MRCRKLAVPATEVYCTDGAAVSIPAPTAGVRGTITNNEVQENLSATGPLPCVVQPTSSSAGLLPDGSGSLVAEFTLTPSIARAGFISSRCHSRGKANSQMQVPRLGGSPNNNHASHVSTQPPPKPCCLKTAGHVFLRDSHSPTL